MDAFCRLCSSESQYYLNIFGDEKFGNTLNYEVINYAYNLQIQVDDELSKYVCRDCSLRIREFKQWKSMAHAVQLKLLEIHRQLQVKKEAESCSVSNDSKESCVNEGDEFQNEGDEYHNEGDEFHEEGNEFHKEGDKLNNKGDEFHSEVIIKQEVEESSPYVEESECSNENGLRVKQGNELQSELIIKQEMDKNRGNEALNIEITNYLPEEDLNTKEQMGPYTTHTMVGANGYPEGYSQKLNPSEMLSCTQGSTMAENCTSWRKGIKCYFCEKEFGFPSLLAQHIRVHTGVKPHTCNFCGKSFSTKGNLKSHFIIHTGEKPFKCHVCGKQFSYKGNLAVHYRTHSGERPFECSVCGKSFSAKSNLLIHHGIHYRDLYPNDESARPFAPLY